MDEARPPYLRIAAELRRRITTGRLRPGDRVPSTRQITQEWGVAMATATKALTTLRQMGLVRPVPGVGTVVADLPARPAAPPDPALVPELTVGTVAADLPARPAPPPGTVPELPAETVAAGPVPPPAPAQELSRERVVRVAIGIADAEGLATLSMRRIAAELGASAMSLYRHVSGKEELLALMTDAVLAEYGLPEPPPPGWRARLELAARTQWALYHRHPWLPQITSFTRPLPTPNAMVQAEWAMRAVDGLGLDLVTMVHVYVTVAIYVHGTAINLEREAEARQLTGTTDDEWIESAVIPRMGKFPLLSQIPPDSLDLNTLFEFGLKTIIDGLSLLIEGPEVMHKPQQNLR